MLFHSVFGEMGFWQQNTRIERTWGFAIPISCWENRSSWVAIFWEQKSGKSTQKRHREKIHPCCTCWDNFPIWGFKVQMALLMRPGMSSSNCDIFFFQRMPGRFFSPKKKVSHIGSQHGRDGLEKTWFCQIWSHHVVSFDKDVAIYIVSGKLDWTYQSMRICLTPYSSVERMRVPRAALANPSLRKPLHKEPAQTAAWKWGGAPPSPW